MKLLLFLVMLFSVISLAINFASECIAMVDDNIVLWFKFDEGSGTIAKDSSIYKNDGTIKGAKWVDGKNGSALSFDGINNIVEVPSTDNLQLSDQGLTIAVWFKTTETARQDLMFIEKGAWDVGEYALSYPGYANFRVRFQINEICGQQTCQIDSTSGVPGLSDNKWHHTAGVYDAVKHTFKVYVDGKLETEQGAAAHKFTPDNQSVFVGSRNNQGLYYFGVIDDLLVAKVPFTDDQVKKHMDGVLFDVSPAGRLTTEWGKIKKMD